MNIRDCCFTKGLLLSLCLLAGRVQAGGDATYKSALSVYESDPARAHALFLQAAEAGNVSAMVGAGHDVETGHGTATNYSSAIKWYDQAVAKNSLKACEGLARIYASCPDPEFHDGELAVKYAAAYARHNLRDAEALALLAAAHARNFDFERAKNTMLDALRRTGLDFLEDRKKVLAGYEKGMPYPAVVTEDWLLKAAERGSVWSLGKCVEISRRNGDDINARGYLELLDQSRTAEQSCLLADYYLNGSGGSVLAEEAVDILLEAADRGSDEACERLGFLYFSGVVVRKDLDLTRKYFEKSNSKSKTCEYIMQLIDSTYHENDLESTSPEGLYKKGKAYSRESSYVDNNPQSSTYGDTITVKPEPVYEFVYCLAAAEQGHLDAMRVVIDIYQNGKGDVQKDKAMAAKWRKKLGELSLQPGGEG